MARLPRLALPGQAHYVIQRARAESRAGAAKVFHDADDRAAFIAALRAAVPSQPVRIHAWAMRPDEWQLLATPMEADALGKLVQDLGRRFVAAYNARHGSRGSPWDGRYRCGVVEPGALRLAALCLVDGSAGGGSGEATGDEAPAADPRSSAWTSAAHRCGGPRDPVVVDPPEWWQLGNTPFERERAYVALLAKGVDAATADRLRRAALGGWVAGSAGFSAEVEGVASRRARPRSAGRPRAIAIR